MQGTHEMQREENANERTHFLPLRRLLVIPSLYLGDENKRLQLSKWAPKLVCGREVGSSDLPGIQSAC